MEKDTPSWIKLFLTYFFNVIFGRFNLYGPTAEFDLSDSLTKSASEENANAAVNQESEPHIGNLQPITQSSPPSLLSYVEKMKNLIELVGKLSIGFVALSYVIGLLVVNIHLNKYGAYSLGIFRLNYISAGMWTLFPVLFPLLLLFILILFAMSYFNSWKRRPFSVWLTLTTMPILVLLSFTLIATRILGIDLFSWEWLGAFPTGFFISVYAISIVGKIGSASDKHTLTFLPSTGLLTIGLCTFLAHRSFCILCLCYYPTLCWRWRASTGPASNGREPYIHQYT
jgi:hypothetical protein